MNKEMQERIIEKSRIKIAISNFKEEDIKMPKKRLLKMCASFVIAIGITSSLVYATTVVYEKIWKEPQSYKPTQEISIEEKEKCISEEEAEKIGNEYLKKIGLDTETIQNLGLMKEFFSQENIWHLGSEKASLSIDAETGKLLSVNIPTWEYKIPYNYGITKEEARVTANELLEKYRPLDDTGEYRMIKLTGNMETDEASYIWYATFQKKYGNLLNKYEEIRIGWIPTINGLYSLNFERKICENNEQKITKEEAIKIATTKDKEIEKEKKIEEVIAEIKIRKMNEQVYLRENFKEEYEKGDFHISKYSEDTTLYKTEERVRYAWCVVVNYENSESAYTYYVDATTGEIIGGAMWDEIKSDKIEYESYID